MFSYSGISIDKDILGQLDEFSIRIKEVKRDRLQYQIQCSQNMIISEVHINFFVADLPESVEIGYLSYDLIPSRSLSDRVKFLKKYSQPPKLLIF